MNRYADCTYCGGEVVEQTIEYDYRRRKHLMIVSNVPAGVCRQCGEKYFKPDILTCLADWIAQHGARELRARLLDEYRAARQESRRISRDFVQIDKEGWPSW